jgi:CMP-N-acetylneuraminic acid synthetase
MSISVVAFVPMRHSSERVPEKNYRAFNGRPLFHWVIETLLEVDRVSQVVVDTDSPVIIDQCRERFPSVVCVERPEHLLGGHVPMTDVLQYDASLFRSDWYLQTHSTNPLLRPETVEGALAGLETSLAEHDSLFGVTRLQTRLFDSNGRPINHDPSILLRTQDLPPVFEENSNLYVYSAELIAAGRRYGERPILYEIDPVEATDIDEEHDFVLAELLHRMRSERTT